MEPRLWGDTELEVTPGYIIGDDDVVEDGVALDLPQVKADEAEVIVLVQVVVIDILRVGDLLGLPEALVRRIGDSLHGPLALVVGVVDHGCLPLAVLLVIPVVRLGGLGIYDLLLLHPAVRLLVLRVVHHAVINPVAGLLVIGILDLFGRQELPVLLQGALVDLLAVDLHLRGVVGLQDQPVPHRPQTRSSLK